MKRALKFALYVLLALVTVQICLSYPMLATVFACIGMVGMPFVALFIWLEDRYG